MMEYGKVRHDYSIDEIKEIYELPIPRLIRNASLVHQEYHADDEVQFCTLLSIKTGGCKEDCAYCPQSAHNDSTVEAHQLLDEELILSEAKKAKDGGATRFCMGAAWRTPPSKGEQFNKVLDVIKKVSDMGLEVCTTLGMLDSHQAKQLKDAGVYAYNHNLDTSPEYYKEIITTRTYQDRIETLKNVREAGMTVCCGGILGMGEQRIDRFGLLKELSSMNPHPESVPVNMLVKIEGTPLDKAEDLDIFEMVRAIATARILMPKSRIRLSAGRNEMTDEAQALCFLAGANSIFTGEKLLTTGNPNFDEDKSLLDRLGMKPIKEHNVL